MQYIDKESGYQHCYTPQYWSVLGHGESSHLCCVGSKRIPCARFLERQPGISARQYGCQVINYSLQDRSSVTYCSSLMEIIGRFDGLFILFIL